MLSGLTRESTKHPEPDPEPVLLESFSGQHVPRPRNRVARGRGLCVALMAEDPEVEDVGITMKVGGGWLGLGRTR